jgi:hypothetical protein
MQFTIGRICLIAIKPGYKQQVRKEKEIHSK